MTSLQPDEKEQDSKIKKKKMKMVARVKIVAEVVTKPKFLVTLATVSVSISSLEERHTKLNGKPLTSRNKNFKSVVLKLGELRNPSMRKVYLWFVPWSD